MKHFESNEMLICSIRQKYIQVYEICTHYQLLESNVCLCVYTVEIGVQVWHLFENDKISKIPIIPRNRSEYVLKLAIWLWKYNYWMNFRCASIFYSPMEIVWKQHTKAAAFVYKIFNYFIAHKIAERFNCVDLFCFCACKKQLNMHKYSSGNILFKFRWIFLAWTSRIRSVNGVFFYIFHHICCHFIIILNST